eukprot:474594_1
MPKKKRRSFCSGLLECDAETCQHIKKYYHLFDNTSYSQVAALQENVESGAFFFCGGGGLKSNGTSKCSKCIAGLTDITELYELFDKANVKEVCKFLDASEVKQWKPFRCSASLGENNEAVFTITIDTKHTNNRNIKWIISHDKLERFDDRSENCWSSKVGTKISSSYLVKHFQKWIANSIRFCRGIIGKEWFKESNFGCSKYSKPKWISNSKLIIHEGCELKRPKSKQKGASTSDGMCPKCKSLNDQIVRTGKKGNFNKTPSKHTPNKCLTAEQQLLKLDDLKEQNDELKYQIKSLEKEYTDLQQAFSINVFIKDAKKNERFGEMISYVLTNYDDIKNGLMNGHDTSKIDFIYDQFRYAKRKYIDYKNGNGPKLVKGIRWSVATIEFGEDIYARGSGNYKTAHESGSLEMPHVSGIKARALQYRHTDMTCMEMVSELKYEFTFTFGSMEEARKHGYHVAMDELIVDDSTQINPSNFSLDGRPAYLTSDNLLNNARQTLFVAKNNGIDHLDGSKYMMQFILRGSTSGFVWCGPFYGSDSGLSGFEIQGFLEDDFLLPLKLNLQIEINSVHADLNTHHQQYVLYKSGKKRLKDLLGAPIKLWIEFYERYILFIPDKDHSVKALRNGVNNCLLWTPLWKAHQKDLQSKHPVLECHEQTFNLDRFNKMNMKYIYDLLSKKTILSLKEIDSNFNIKDLSISIKILELMYDFYMGNYLNTKIGYKNTQVKSLGSEWFEKCKSGFDNLVTWIETNWKHLVGKKLATITKVSIHGLYYGMKELAEEILDLDEEFYFCPFAFGEAIVEKVFCKVRSVNKAKASDYATGIAKQNSSIHRKQQKKKRAKQNL